MAIRIFITGSTIKEYNELNGQLYFKETHMQDLLLMGRNSSVPNKNIDDR
jgi:L-asparaginase